MCGISAASIKNKEVSLYVGYYGGSIFIDDTEYTDETLSDNTAKEEFQKTVNAKFTKKELIDVITQFVLNGDEG